MAHVGHISRLTQTIEAVDVNSTSPDELLHQLNRQIASMLEPGAVETEADLAMTNGGADFRRRSSTGATEENAELLQWKIVMVHLASVQQQSSEAVFQELLRNVQNDSYVHEWSGCGEPGIAS